MKKLIFILLLFLVGCSNPCEQKVTAEGECEALHLGYQYENGECKEKEVAGCEYETPFESLEQCKNTCGLNY